MTTYKLKKRFYFPDGSFIEPTGLHKMLDSYYGVDEDCKFTIDFVESTPEFFEKVEYVDNNGLRPLFRCGKCFNTRESKDMLFSSSNLWICRNCQESTKPEIEELDITKGDMGYFKSDIRITDKLNELIRDHNDLKNQVNNLNK